MNFANVGVKISADDAQFRQALDGAKGRADRWANDVSNSLNSTLGQFLTVGAIAGGLKMAFDAADRLAASSGRLAGEARLAGISLEGLQAVAARANESFKLGTIQSNEFTTAVSRLTNKAGDLSQTGAALEALLDLGASKRLTSEQTLTAIQQAILGIDEGTDKLFGKNPSVLYAEYAAQIGTTAGKLDDQKKAQALLNAVLDAGEKTRGEYSDWLETAAGQQAQLAIKTEEAAGRIGVAMEGLRTTAIPALAGLMDYLVAFVGGIQILAVDLGEFAERAKMEVNRISLRTRAARDTGILPSGLNIGGANASWIFDAQALWRRATGRSLDNTGFNETWAQRENRLNEASWDSQIERLREAAKKEREAVIAAMGAFGDLLGGTSGGTSTSTGGARGGSGRMDGSLRKAVQRLDEFAESLKRPREVSDALAGIPDDLGRWSLGLASSQEDVEMFSRRLNKAADGLADFAYLADQMGLGGVGNILGGASNIASGIERIGSGEFTNIGQLLTSGGAIQALSGIMTVGSTIFNGLFGGNKEHQELLRRNNESLDQMRRSLDHLAGTFGRQGNVASLFEGLNVGGFAGQTQFAVRLANSGLSLDQVADLAQSLGITLLDSKGRIVAGALSQLEEALRLSSLSVEEFGKTLEGQRRLMDARRDIFDITDPGAVLRDQYALLLEGLSEAAEVQFGLAGLDLSTKEGQQAFEEGLRALFEAFASGGLDALKDLPGFSSVDEFLEALLGADNALDRMADSANKAANAVTDIPKAVNLALYRSRIAGSGGSVGGGGTINPPDGPARPHGQGMTINGGFNITVVNEAGDTPETLGKKMEQAAIHFASGGGLVLRGVRVVPA